MTVLDGFEDIDIGRLIALAQENPDAVIAEVGEERLLRLWKYARYMGETPARAREDLIELARYLMPDPDHPFDPDQSRYKVAIHHRIIADALTSVMDGRCLRLALSIPPQFGKSTLARTFVAAHIGRFPWKHLLMGAYNSTFAKEYGDDVRALLISEEYGRVYPHVGLRPGGKAKDHLVTSENGKISFLGREGSGSGRPADGFLIDDPLKDAKEAGSKTVRDDVWQWYTRVANARCHALSWQVIIMTRWSDDDLIARLTDPQNPYYKEEVASQWTVINVPAEIDTEEMARALGKNVGEALWPERFPIQLLRTAKALDPVGYSALYMGRPTPPEGSFYKEWMFRGYLSPREFPRHGRMYMTGDLAVSADNNKADKTCFGIWSLDENDELWLHPDLYWDRKASDESVDKIIEMGQTHKIMEAFMEKGALDRAIGPFLEKRMQELSAYFTISKMSVVGNKAMRSISIRGRMSQGKVHFPIFAPWWPAAKEQLLKFTGTGDDKEDDLCDMLALIGQAMGDTIKGNSESSNVVGFPKVGSFAWTKWASNKERERQRRIANLRGM